MEILGAASDRRNRSHLIRLFFVGIALALSVVPSRLATATQGAAQPELPRVILDTTYAPPTGRTITVNAGDDFQAALNSAALGDVIMLQAGAAFTGTFILPAKTGSGWITIRTSAPDSSLPPPGTRITPAYANILPKILAPVNGVRALEAANGAHHYRLMGLEFSIAPGIVKTYSIVSLGEDQTSLAQLPHNIILDRVYIHGSTTADVRRGVALNSASSAVIDSYISDCHERGVDSQAILGWNGPGPFKIVNNYLEGAGENIMFGGAPPTIPNLVPSDIEFRRNHCFKPLVWKADDPSYNGIDWSIKNLFELKNAQRVLIEGNIFEHNWQDSQVGFAILFTVRNEAGAAPWAVVQDVTFINNIIRHSGGGIDMHGRDDISPPPSAIPSRRFKIANNLFEDIDSARWGNATGMLFQIVSGVGDLTIDHNTAIQSGNIAVADVLPPSENFVFTNNLMPNNEYGFFGSGQGQGIPALDYYFPGAVFKKNAIVGGSANLYPADNFFPATFAEIGFVNFSGGNYRLAPSSPYRNAGTDGKDIGCNFDALHAAFAPEADLRIAKSNGVSSVNAGGVATYTIVVANNGPSAANNATFSDPAAAGLNVTGVTCNPGGGGAACPAPGSVTAAAMQGAGITIPALPSGGTVTFTVTALVTATSGSVTNTATVTPPTGVADSAPGNNTSSDTDPVNPRVEQSVNALAGPGQPYPSQSGASDDKAGSLLIYNIYRSSAASPEHENTRINLTNTNPSSDIVVHLFFVDGEACSVADAFICLTPNQTTTFLASEIDPGVTGYLVAIAVDGVTGCPRSFNFLIGDEFVRFSSGHRANLGAVAFAALYDGVLPECDDKSITATIAFNGTTGYNSLPRALALDNIPDRASGNDTMLILNRISGDLTTRANTLEAIFGILYNDTENAFSFTVAAGSCQFRSSLTNNFPRTTPRVEQIIPDGRSGWMKLWLSSDAGLLGAVINLNRNANSSPNAFNGGHNLRKLTLASGSLDTYTIPVFPPNCPR
jgi:uncharacterized repeat protein (TIGR01451 family)